MLRLNDKQNFPALVWQSKKIGARNVVLKGASFLILRNKFGPTDIKKSVKDRKGKILRNARCHTITPESLQNLYKSVPRQMVWGIPLQVLIYSQSTAKDFAKIFMEHYKFVLIYRWLFLSLFSLNLCPTANRMQLLGHQLPSLPSYAVDATIPQIRSFTQRNLGVSVHLTYWIWI